MLPGVWDALSAHLAGRSRIRRGVRVRASACRRARAMPDVGAAHADRDWPTWLGRVCAAVPGSLVVVDGDTGYGNAVDVIRTVEMWEAAGAAGVFLEDQVWPNAADTWPASRSSRWTTGSPSSGPRVTTEAPARDGAYRRAGSERTRRRDRAGEDGARRRCRRGVRRGAREHRRVGGGSRAALPMSYSWPTWSKRERHRC